MSCNNREEEEPNKYLIELYGYTRLHLAETEEELVKLLTVDRIPPNIKTKPLGLTALHTIKHPSLVKILVYFGADVNETTTRGSYAASMDDKNVLKNLQLIKYGSFINVEKDTSLLKPWLYISINMITF
jgi:hypothetical protein